MNVIILNLKAVFLPDHIVQDDKNQEFIKKTEKSIDVCPFFDPVAVKEIQKMIDQTKSKIVITDNWFWTKDFEITKYWCKKNGLKIKFHNFFQTPKKMSSYRINEIQWWIEENEKDNLLLILDEDYTMRNIVSKSSFEIKEQNIYIEKYAKYIGKKRRKNLIPQFEYLQFEEKKLFYGKEVKKIVEINEKIGLTKDVVSQSWNIINSSLKENNE